MSMERREVLLGLAAGAAAGWIAGAAQAAESDVFVIAEVVAKPEAADELRRLFVEFVAEVRKEPGCKHYSLLEDPAKAGSFYTFETWADKAAVDAHMNTPTIKAFGAKLGNLLAKPPVITPLKMLSDG